jgi:hypothetical protein
LSKRTWGIGAPAVPVRSKLVGSKSRPNVIVAFVLIADDAAIVCGTAKLIKPTIRVAGIIRRRKIFLIADFSPQRVMGFSTVNIEHGKREKYKG